MIDQAAARKQTEAMRDLALAQVKFHLADHVSAVRTGGDVKAAWNLAAQWEALWRQLLLLLGEPLPADSLEKEI